MTNFYIIWWFWVLNSGKCRRRGFEEAEALFLLAKLLLLPRTNRPQSERSIDSWVCLVIFFKTHHQFFLIYKELSQINRAGLWIHSNQLAQRRTQISRFDVFLCSCFICFHGFYAACVPHICNVICNTVYCWEHHRVFEA